MPFKLVKGEIALLRQGANGVVGSEPDGDGVWFKPDNPNNLKNFNGRTSKFNQGGFINLRLEGIDALEIHYQGEHQLLDPAKKARGELLKALGFSSVTFGEGGAKVTASTPGKVKAHILTRGLDGTYNHRPISFVYPGQHSGTDGSNVFLGVATADQSLNAELMRKGLVYPLYYDTLPPDIRDHLTELAIDAFNKSKGLWDGIDSSNDFNAINGMQNLRDLAIWPKLFRRLKDYFSRQPNGSIKKFDKALREGTVEGIKDDELTIVAESHVEANANMHDIYELKANNKIRMKFYPEEIIIKGD
jgi:endonuclease YncB( thermonuclease family)